MEKTKITRKEVLHIADLSRLSFDDKELEKIGNDLGDILGYVKELQKVDTSKVGNFTRETGILRDDTPKESLTTTCVVKNAPSHNDNSFIVPRVVE